MPDKRPEDMTDKELYEALANSRGNVLLTIANVILKTSDVLIAYADYPEEIKSQSKNLARFARDLVKAAQDEKEGPRRIN